MCGIIWVKQRNGKAAFKKLRKAYSAQKTRGTDGFGYVEINKGIAGTLTRNETEKGIFQILSSCRAEEILFHHRMPTSTINVPATAHPIPVSHASLEYDYYVVHNGVISNHELIKKDQDTLGFKYTTEMIPCWYTNDGVYYINDKEKVKYNDSETFAIDIAQAIEQGKDKTACKGTIAFMALQVDKKTRKAVSLFFGRNEGRPLVYQEDNNFFCISSEGSGVEIDEHKLHCYDYATNTFITVRDMVIGEKNTPPPVKRHGHGSAYKPVPYFDHKEKKWMVWSTTLGKAVEHIHEAGFDTSGAGSQNLFSLPNRTAHKTTGEKLDDLAKDIDALYDRASSTYDQDSMEYYEWLRSRGTSNTEPDKRMEHKFIPGMDGSPVMIKTSGGVKSFYFEDELQESFANLTEEIEHWGDLLHQARKDKDESKIQEYEIYYNELVQDEKNYQEQFAAIYPPAVATS